MTRAEDPRHAILRELGLSDYAARAYLALLELGTTEARDVARPGRVPVAKIYSTLDQLAQKGFCLILPESPKRFAPEPMERVLHRIERIHLDEAARARARVGELAAKFPISPKGHAGDRGSAVILRGRPGGLGRASQLGEGAKDVLILASDHLVHREGRALAAAHRGRRRILFVDRADGATFVESIPATVDAKSVPNLRGAPNAVSIRVFDDDAVLLTHHVPDDASERAGEDVSVLILEQAIVRALRDLLERAWSGDAPLSRGASMA